MNQYKISERDILEESSLHPRMPIEYSVRRVLVQAGVRVKPPSSIFFVDEAPELEPPFELWYSAFDRAWIIRQGEAL